MKTINVLYFAFCCIVCTACYKADRRNDLKKLTPDYTFLDTCIGNGTSHYLKYYEENVSASALVKTGNFYAYANDVIMKFDPITGAVDYRTYKSWVRGAVGDSLGNLYFSKHTEEIVNNQKKYVTRAYMFNLWSGIERTYIMPDDGDNLCVNNDTNWVYTTLNAVTMCSPDFNMIKTTNVGEKVYGIKYKNSKFFIRTNSQIIITDNNLNYIKAINIAQAYSYMNTIWKISDDETQYIAHTVGKTTTEGPYLNLSVYTSNNVTIVKDKKVFFQDRDVAILDLTIGPNSSLFLCGKETIYLKDKYNNTGEKAIFCSLDNGYVVSNIKSYGKGNIPNTLFQSIEYIGNDSYLVCGETSGFNGNDVVLRKKMLIAKLDANGNYCN